MLIEIFRYDASNKQVRARNLTSRDTSVELRAFVIYTGPRLAMTLGAHPPTAHPTCRYSGRVCLSA